MKGLKFHMLRDPDATVRICALKTIEVNTDTVKGMFTATRDECNSIRKSGALSFLVCGKISPITNCFYFLLSLL